MVLTVLLGIAAAITALLAVKWWIAAAALSHYIASHGLEPTDSELKSSTRFVINKLFHS